MKIKNRYFTKSKFKIASECPTRLFYFDKPQYANQNEENPFLEALAEGGYQAGELAKQYYPNGHDLRALNSAEAITKTKKLLLLDEVVIFEAAIQHNNLLIRVDILTKNNNHLQLIEVKAKSIDFDTEDPFLTQKGFIQSEWFPYLNDVAFQKYVLISAFPKSSITSYLMLINKNVLSPTNGLNQKFKVIKDHNNHKSIEVSSTLDKEDNGKGFWVDTDAQTMTLLTFAAATALDILVMNGGAFGTVAVSVDPAAGDLISGPDDTGADGGIMVNTKVTARRGDYVKLVTGGDEGYLVSEKKGIWTIA